MSQTMLGILALMLATMFAVQQQRHAAHTRMGMIRTEIGTQSTGVAVDRLEEIGSKAFDEATIGNVSYTTSDSLTAVSAFKLDAPGNDIDDFHGVTIDTFRVATSDTLWFRVQSTISYASETSPDQVVSGPTKVKKATVKVYNLTVPAPDTITLSQSYACGSRCNW